MIDLTFYPQNRLSDPSIIKKDTTEILAMMVDGNIGATKALMEILTKYKSIDPDAFLGGLGVVFDLDALGIYGSNIWILFKDVCDFNVLKIAVLFRAKQLGIIHESMILNAIGDSRDPGRAKKGGNPIGFEVLLKSIQEQVPKFNFGERASLNRNGD